MNSNVKLSRMILVFLTLKLMVTAVVWAQAPIANSARNDSVYIADARIQLHDLKDYTSVYVDSSNELTIREISSKEFSSRFHPIYGNSQPAQPYITYWLKFSITPSENIQDWWLLLNDDSAFADYTAENCYVDVYFLNSDNLVTDHQRTGIFVPRSQKEIKENTGLNRISISLNEGETRNVYLKIYNEYGPALISSLQLRNPVLGEPPQSSNFLLSVLIGVLFFFTIISIFFFYFVRDKSYLFFGLYTLFLSQLYLLLHPGFLFVDLYIPEHPQLSVPIFNLIAVCVFIFFFLFGRYFIDLPKLSKRFDIIFKWIIIMWAISALIINISTVITHRVSFTELNYVFIIVLLIFLGRIAFFKSILVRFYVAGALWLLSFSLLGLLWGRFQLPLPFNPWPVGQIGQLLIYSVGLAYKVRLNEESRTKAELIRLRNIELANLYAESKLQKEEIEVQKKNAEDALTVLKAAQSQLIQSEKMASLGELTAGIAHEIQNPLNFVNNFSEVSAELIDEMNTEIEKGNTEDAKQIAADLKQNLEKINHHGKRAGDIVKGMLQHSRTSSGVKEPADINALADEYLRLAYHGLRAKDKTFNAKTETDFDESIGKINIIPQDIGRVILNLITNAFYAVDEKKKNQPDGYEPIVKIITRKTDDNVMIYVKDNGNGIPQNLLDKIFQPFFTTKPTGQGTGLGLSLSYDIIKAHGGDLKVATEKGHGTEFTISLNSK